MKVTFIACLALAAVAWAADDNTVCPLSERQVKAAQEAFSKLSPIFREPRCLNCHGAVNPFAPESEGHHGGGQIKFQPPTEPGDFLTTFGECNSCHDNFKGTWMTPPPDMSWVGLDDPALCRLMKTNSFSAEHFLDHMTRDHGGAPFIATGFEGTRGLSNVTAKPITIMSHAQMIKLTQDWIQAMGGKFRGGPDCGCQPHHYAFQVYHVGQFDAAGGAFDYTLIGQKGEPEANIRFYDDGSLVAKGAGAFITAGTVAEPMLLCKTGGVGRFILMTIAGTIKDVPFNPEAPDQSKEHLDVQFEGDPGQEAADTFCATPVGAVGGPTSGHGVQRVVLEYSMDGEVDKAETKPIPLALPGYRGIIRLKIIKKD